MAYSNLVIIAVGLLGNYLCFGKQPVGSIFSNVLSEVSQRTVFESLLLYYTGLAKIVNCLVHFYMIDP